MKIEKIYIYKIQSSSIVKKFEWLVTKINSIFWTNSARAKSWFNYFQPLVFWELPLTTFYHSTHRMFGIPGNNRANYNWIPNEKSGPKGWLKLLQSNYESSVRESRMLIRNRRAQYHWQCITVSLPSFQLSHPPLLIVAHSSARLWKLITHQRALLIRLRAVIIGSWISYYGTKRQQNSLPRKIGHPYCPPLIRLLVISKAFIKCYVTEARVVCFAA